LLDGKELVTFATHTPPEMRRFGVRANGWWKRVRLAAFSIATLAALLAAGGANWPRH
jgi:hypothetical protein